MFVLWSALAAAAERALAPGQAAGSRALVPDPLWASAGVGGVLLRSRGPEPSPCSLWSGPDGATVQRPLTCPGSPSLNLLCTLLETAALRFLRAPHPQTSWPGAAAVLRRALAPEHPLPGQLAAAARPGPSRGARTPRRRSGGQGAGHDFLGWARKGRGLPAGCAGRGDRPRKSPFPIFNTISFISTRICWCPQQQLQRGGTLARAVMPSGGKSSWAKGNLAV